MIQPLYTQITDEIVMPMSQMSAESSSEVITSLHCTAPCATDVRSRAHEYVRPSRSGKYAACGRALPVYACICVCGCVERTLKYLDGGEGGNGTMISGRAPSHAGGMASVGLWGSAVIVVVFILLYHTGHGYLFLHCEQTNHY